MAGHAGDDNVILMCPCNDQSTDYKSSGSEIICGANKSICSTCARASLNWSRVNDSCLTLDSVQILRSGCTTTWIPFPSETKVCMGQHVTNESRLRSRRQTFGPGNVANDSRIFVEYDNTSIKYGLTTTGQLTVSIDTSTFGCPDTPFQIDDGNGSLSRMNLMFTADSYSNSELIVDTVSAFV